MTSAPRLRICGPIIVLAIAAISVWLAPPFATGAANAPSVSPDGVWRSLDAIPAAASGARQDIKAAQFKAFTVTRNELSAKLLQAPKEFTAAAKQSGGTEITLPAPDGSFARFRVEEIAIMEPELAAKYPGIKTYRGRGIDDPAAVLHFDVNPWTMHAQVLTPSGTWYVDPYWHGDGSVYMSYGKKDLLRGDRQFE